MLSAAILIAASSNNITSFLKLISAQLEETSRGVISFHHFHNVHCGIENILSLLEYNNDVVEKADQLSRRASSYITRHDLISSNVSDGDVSEDANRRRAGGACRLLLGGRAKSTELQVSHARTSLSC
jgi:hypothetical protein